MTDSTYYVTVPVVITIVTGNARQAADVATAELLSEGHDVRTADVVVTQAASRNGNVAPPVPAQRRLRLVPDLA